MGKDGERGMGQADPCLLGCGRVFLPPSTSALGFALPLQKEELSEKERWQHLADLADFALAMKETLMNINYQSFNNFMLRIGKCCALGMTGVC